MSSDALRSAAIPGPHLIGAAAWAASLIDECGTPVAVAHDSYLSAATGGIYGRNDLTAGEALLLRAGLLVNRHGVLCPVDPARHLRQMDPNVASELVISMLLDSEQPLWLAGLARGGEIRYELLPDADLTALEQCVPDPLRREELLLALGRRFNDEARRALGAAAEEFVVEASRRFLTEHGAAEASTRVVRVSLASDQLGYDVTAPTLGGRTARMEVKAASVDADNLSIFLSRNEANIAMRDPGWALVICLKRVDTFEVAGWVRGPALEQHLPLDTPRGRWESVRIQVSRASLRPGLPLR